MAALAWLHPVNSSALNSSSNPITTKLLIIYSLRFVWYPMGEIKLQEAPAMTIITKGMPFTPKSPAIAMAMGNMNAAEATLVIILLQEG